MKIPGIGLVTWWVYHVLDKDKNESKASEKTPEM